MSLTAFLAVGVGGAFGALCRNKATSFLKPLFPKRFPFPTLCINLVSCTLAGILLAIQMQINDIMYLALTMGFLGGFSTLSTMNFEAVELVSQRHYTEGLGYLAATYASTIGAAALGFALTLNFAS